MIIIKEVTNEQELLRVCRLRYEVYIDEMGRTQQFADHERRRIREPYDDYSNIFFAEVDGEVIGTVRSTFAGEGPLECEELYYLRRFPLDRRRISMTTKLIVREQYRDSMIAARLAMATFESGAASGIRLDFIDCDTHLRHFYEKMGHRTYHPPIDHPEYGHVLPMVLALDDVAYLESIRSPFRRLARRYFGSGPYLGAEAFYALASSGSSGSQLKELPEGAQATRAA
jgi:hypothetical protein